MRRSALPLLLAAACAGCVSVAPMPDPRGALKPGQRLVVSVYPSPGPWIIDGTDSKAAAAGKITPLGFLIQTTEDSHTLTVSKNLQQYLPRPRLGLQFQESLLKSLRAGLSTGTVQTDLQAGIAAEQLVAWNKAKDQLDWRQRYYAPDPDQPPPRDYAHILTLDDALILDVNVSFGTDANDDGHLLPQMTAASRVYRGDTMRLLWEHEDAVAETTSSSTLTDYQVQPWTLTDSLKKLAPALGAAVSASFIKAFTVAASTTAPTTPAPHISSGGGGLVPMSAFQNLDSTSAPAGAAPPATAAPALSTAAAAGIAVSSGAVASPPPVPAPAPPLAALPGASAASPAAVSTPTVSAPAVSTPTVSMPAVSTPSASAPASPPH